MVSDALKREIKKLDRQWAGSLRDASDFLFEMEQKSSMRAQRSERAPSSFRGYRHLFYHPVSGKPYDVWEDKNAGVAGGVLALMKTLATGETADIDGLCRLDDVAAEAGYIADSLHLLAQISPASSGQKPQGIVFQPEDVRRASAHAATLTGFCEVLHKRGLVERFIAEARTSLPPEEQSMLDERLAAQSARRETRRFHLVQDETLTKRTEDFVRQWREPCGQIDAALALMRRKTAERKWKYGPRDQFKWSGITSGADWFNMWNRGSVGMLALMETAISRPQGTTMHELRWLEQAPVYLNAAQTSCETLIAQQGIEEQVAQESGKPLHSPFSSADIGQICEALDVLKALQYALADTALTADLAGYVREARPDITDMSQRYDETRHTGPKTNTKRIRWQEAMEKRRETPNEGKAP